MPGPDFDPMTPSWAVFNNHINAADAKARALMRAIAPVDLARVEELEQEGGGIMHIFNVPKEPATVMYALLVTAYVNYDHVEDVLI